MYQTSVSFSPTYNNIVHTQIQPVIKQQHFESSEQLNIFMYHKFPGLLMLVFPLDQPFMDPLAPKIYCHTVLYTSLDLVLN